MSYDILTITGSPRGFAINGRQLAALVETGDRVCVFAGIDHAKGYAKQLLLRAPSELPSGRCPLYLCHLCGDLGCGAVSVRVTEVDDCFVWSELSIESPGGCQPVTWRDETAERDFYFAREDYLAVIY
jgi:hypothetical protein